jgi:hypothetical protein
MQRMLLLYCFLSFASGLHAEILDRMIAVVDGHIFTASDVRQEREISMRLGDKAIADDKALIQQMIDNYLIEAQIADFPGADVTDAEVDEELKKSVQADGIPSPAIREAVRKRMRMRKYFDLRFGQFIRPSDEDIRSYYNNVFLPAAQARNLDPLPPLEKVTDLIRSNVIQEAMDHEITIWLEAIRRRSSIEVFQ